MEHIATSIAGVCLASLFVLYLGRRTSQVNDPRLQGQILPAIAFDFGHWLLGTVVPVFRYLRMTPNLLSFLSVPMSMSAAGAIATGHFALGGVLLMVAFSLDACDGALARALGIASAAGEAVDAMVDRYNDVIVMMGFLYYFRGELLPWLIGAAALIGTVAVSYIRAKGASLGVDTDLGCMQRHERAVWLTVATVVAPTLASIVEEPSSHPAHYAVIVALAAVAIGTNITAVRRAHFVFGTLDTRHEE